MEEEKNNISTLENINKGHTQIPHIVLNALILIGLLQRDLDVVLLISRLTYGCLNQKWAKLRQRDLQIISISESHAKEVITRLLETEIIVQNGRRKEFRINEEYLTEVTKKGSFLFEKLRKLIGKQFARETSLESKAELPEMGSKNLPAAEVITSQESKLLTLPQREVSATPHNGFATFKDILKICKYSDKDTIANNSSNNKIIDPRTFIPEDEGQAAARYAWENLEPSNLLAFSTTYYANYKKGLPSSFFYQFVSEIKQDETIKNRGAIFNSKASCFFEQRANKEGNA